jgi:hypothetical protein
MIQVRTGITRKRNPDLGNIYRGCIKNLYRKKSLPETRIDLLPFSGCELKTGW